MHRFMVNCSVSNAAVRMADLWSVNGVVQSHALIYLLSITITQVPQSHE
jgi:uncharacterized membrane protein